MANFVNNASLDNIKNFIDVVSSYSCKMCDFSSPNATIIRTHVAVSHLNSSAPNEGDRFSVCKNEPVDSVDLNVLVSTSEDSNIVGVMKFNSENVIKLNFICSFCKTSFSSSNITQHMVSFHGVQAESLTGINDSVTSLQITPSSMLRNVVSTGTQVELIKQRGRKRKIITAEPLDEDLRDDNETAVMNQEKVMKKRGRKRKVIAAEQLDEDKDSGDGDETADNVEGSTTRTKVSQMMEVSRLREDVSNCLDLPKRQVRPPKTLIDDYHIIHQRHWKRNVTSSVAETKLQCGLEGCGALFSSEKGIEYHVSCHVMDGDDPGSQFCCPECSETFTTWIDIRVHLLESHNIVVDRFSCDSCDFCAETASLLEEHNIAVHAMETTADEEYTPKVSTGLKRGRKPRQPAPVEISESTDAQNAPEETECPDCKRKFADQKSMRRHIEIVHEKVKRFMCSLCGHSTAYKAMLHQHMRKHTGEKPYRCDLCLYSGNDRNTLLRHRARHSQQKPFPCSFCAYSYIREKSLKQHLESKHTDAAAAPAEDGATTPKVPRCKRSVKGAGKAEKVKASKLVPTVYACHVCRYQTVNKRSYLTHMSTHGDFQQQPPDGAPVVVEPTTQLSSAVTEVCAVLSSLADAATSIQTIQVCAV